MSEIAVETPAVEAAVEEPLAGGQIAGEAVDGTTVGSEAAAPEAPVAAPVEPQVDPRELQAELDHVREQYGQVAGLVEQLTQGRTQTQQQQQAAPAGFDVSQLVDEYGQVNAPALVQLMQAQQQALLTVFDQRMQQLAEPLAAQAQEQQTDRYVELIDDIVTDNTARNGDLTPKAREFMESRAVQMLPELNQRFGTNPDGSTRPRVLEMAIERAASEVRELLGDAATSATTAQANQLATLAGANGEPGAGVGGAGQGTQAFKSPREVVDFYSKQARTIHQQ